MSTAESRTPSKKVSKKVNKSRDLSRFSHVNITRYSFFFSRENNFPELLTCYTSQKISADKRLLEAIVCLSCGKFIALSCLNSLDHSERPKKSDIFQILCGTSLVVLTGHL